MLYDNFYFCLYRVFIVTSKVVTTISTAVIIVLPLVEPASTWVVQVIALIDCLISKAILAVKEPETNELLLLATLITAFTPVACSTQVNATTLLCICIGYTENVLCKCRKLSLKCRAFLELL